MGIGIQTTPKQDSDGTVLIAMRNGKIEEVISDVQLNVQIFYCDADLCESFPSRPLWDYVRKTTQALMNKQ